MGITNFVPVSGSGLTQLTISSPTTWPELVNAEASLANLNAHPLDSTGAWIVNPNTAASWKQTPKTPTTLTNGFLAQDGRVNGYPLFSTTECDNVAIFSTKFSSVLVLMAG